MSALLHGLLGAPSWLVLTVAGALVFAEDALFVGFVLPGETAAVLAGVAARLGHAPLAAVIATVVLAAVVGDSVGYEVGRRLGPRILARRAMERHRDRLTGAQQFLRRHGTSAVFLARWTAFLRAVMPALAGVSRIPYPRFLVVNAAGGLTWGTTAVVAGYLAGASYARVEKALGRDTAAVVLGVVVAALVAGAVRRRLRQRRRSAAIPGGPA